MRKLIIILLVVFIYACEKVNNNKGSQTTPPIDTTKKPIDSNVKDSCHHSILQGVYISKTTKDTLFIDSMLKTTNNDPCLGSLGLYKNQYEYCIKGDSIELQYKGPCMIWTSSHTFSYSLKSSILSFNKQSTSHSPETWYYHVTEYDYIKIK